MIEVGGRSFSVTAMNATSSVAITNSGSAINASETTEIARSAERSRRIPDQTPNASETGRSTSRAPIARTSDFPIRAEMNDVTGSCEATEVPRSPRTTPEAHRQYCSGRGWSRPSCLR
jgi:hypothetical protein